MLTQKTDCPHCKTTVEVSISAFCIDFPVGKAFYVCGSCEQMVFVTFENNKIVEAEVDHENN